MRLFARLYDGHSVNSNVTCYTSWTFVMIYFLTYKYQSYKTMLFNRLELGYIALIFNFFINIVKHINIPRPNLLLKLKSLCTICRY